MCQLPRAASVHSGRVSPQPIKQAWMDPSFDSPQSPQSPLRYPHEQWGDDEPLTPTNMSPTLQTPLHSPIPFCEQFPSVLSSVTPTLTVSQSPTQICDGDDESILADCVSHDQVEKGDLTLAGEAPSNPNEKSDVSIGQSITTDCRMEEPAGIKEVTDTCENSNLPTKSEVCPGHSTCSIQSPPTLMSLASKPKNSGFAQSDATDGCDVPTEHFPSGNLLLRSVCK